MSGTQTCHKTKIIIIYWNKSHGQRDKAKQKRHENVSNVKCDIDHLTAGSAKNEMPNNAQNDAMIFPCHVSGTISP